MAHYCFPSPSQINDTLVVKSGSDFRDFSEITVNFTCSRPEFSVIRHSITSDIPPDPGVADRVNQDCAYMQEGMKEQIG